MSFKAWAGLAVILVSLIGCVGWGMNLYKLVKCDFSAPYKAEVIRTVGVFLPPVGAITGYIDLGN